MEYIRAIRSATADGNGVQVSMVVFVGVEGGGNVNFVEWVGEKYPSPGGDVMISEDKERSVVVAN